MKVKTLKNLKSQLNNKKGPKTLSHTDLAKLCGGHYGGGVWVIHGSEDAILSHK